ncbi:proline--tRNA ligase [Paenibacillus psychroresistens]|uniref:Proline--tRNA ligase n=1 Tax=Paenibacillus psychroresistens TaxID=1778678 RepID=A0A6B8RWR5_9BACL|nr:proline--tRNA ligase [Paenibacillus psychroresistens]QGR00046.1 proline--tRNA ligase [Paenibacillus psychroresistens]
MHQSKLWIPTLREVPSDAEAKSHSLMLRAGLIRQLAAGIYSFLPLGWRVLNKVSQIVREEMDRIETQEVLMPAMQPAELWQESGRYAVYGDELIRFRDRHDREFALGPTHEEVITTLIRNEISSYRQLPISIYQIQTKYRDERRPRFGLLRGREFLMKDAYSFDASWEGLNETYWKMHGAYCRIFDRIGLNYRAVEADAGAIGGSGETHEFMALSDIGEDTIISCVECDYAANLEKAEFFQSQETATESDKSPASCYEKIHTPQTHTIEQLVQSLDRTANSFIKTLIFVADGEPIAVLVRGDHEVNETKVKNYLGAEEIELANADIVLNVTGAPFGFAGPLNLAIPLLVDREVAGMTSGIVGANEVDYHLINIQPSRDFSIEEIGDFRNANQDDVCPRCKGNLHFSRGIEIGHVFKLGTKYSEKLGGKFLDQTGKEQWMIMGCYGIGVSRLLSAIVEQSNDLNGIIWPRSIAPYQVHLIPVSVKDSTQMELSELLYSRLISAGIEVLIDDRDERPGVKFKDADLIGIPIQVIVGKLAGDGFVEFKERRTPADKIAISIEDAFLRITELINS